MPDAELHDALKVLIILFRVTIYSLAAIGFAALMGGFNVF